MSTVQPSLQLNEVGRSGLCPIGISASDFDLARGLTAIEVYQVVDYIEYGGFAPPARDPDVTEYLNHFPHKYLGRHLVRTELVLESLGAGEVRKIKNDLAGVTVKYLVTDFGFWHLGPESEANVWARPCVLTSKAAKRIGRNVKFLEDNLGLPLFVENPYSEFFVGDLSMTDFLSSLAAEGVRLCLDIGHFIAACRHQRRYLKAELAHLPFAAIGMAHIAGLARVNYGNAHFLLDNHTILPSDEALCCLDQILQKAELQRVTYEAETAAMDIQLAGLRKVGRRLK